MSDQVPETAPETGAAEQPGENRKKIRLIPLLVGILIFLTVILAAIILLLYRNVRPIAAAELGEGLPEGSIFMKDGSPARFVDPPAISETEEGNYRLTVTDGKLARRVLLRVRDTLPPEAGPADPVITLEEGLDPADALSYARDPSGFEAVWETEPPFGTVGVHSVAVLLTDALGHQTRVPVTVRIVEREAELTVEAGSPLPTPGDFLEVPEGTLTCEALKNVDTDLPGSYPLTLEYGGKSFSAVLNVTDTVAPRGEPVACETHCGYPLEPACFVTAVEDVTEVNITFEKEPDWSGEGEIPVSLLLTDTSGNVARVESACTLIREEEPPRLFGVLDRTCYVGEAVAYFAGVSAADNYDAPEAIDLTVDRSRVDIREPGTYPVTYTATDRSGNSVSKTCNFIFIEPVVTDEELDALADEVLEKILSDDMDLTDQAYAIFCYVYSHIVFTDPAKADYTDWKLAAYNALTKGTGDCFNFYATAYLLLDKIGVPTVPVSHYVRGKHHFWLLVDLGTGWYHFDATTLRRDKIPAYWAFMRTTAELRKMPSGKYFWNFDESAYPEVETEPFEYPNRGRYVTAEPR